MNPSGPRLKRAAPERSAPVRNRLVNEGQRRAPYPAATPNDTLGRALECGVQTAYAVIDEYMRRGYEAARLSQDRANGKGHMSNDSSNYGSWSSPWGPMTPLMEQWSGAIRAWTCAWSAFMPGSRLDAWPLDAWSTGSYASKGAAQTVSVKISSHRPTEVIANLKPGADHLSKLVADSFVPPLINGVTMTREGGHLGVTVAVAHEQAAGRYSGVIRGADGSVAGDITVVITEPSQKPA